MFTQYSVSESSILKLSVAGAGLLALVGVLFGLWANSLAIMFDGTYSLVSLLLSLLSLKALKVAESPADLRFNFGRLQVEPLVIALKGLVIAVICVLSFVAAVHALLNGGREIAAARAIGFSLLCVVLCFAIWWRLRNVNQRLQSALVNAEQQQWWMDAVLSCAVLLGFAAAWWLQYSRWPQLAPYADPLLVILVSGFFIRVPLQMIWQAVTELLWISPPAALRKQVYRELEALGISHRQCKMAKSGSYLLLEVQIGVEHAAQMAGLQQQLTVSLQGLPLEPVVWIDFYYQPKVPRTAAKMPLRD